MRQSLQTDVIIVGAGPTGLMAANHLARFGIDFLILDKKGGPTPESRAILVTARSLEIYQQLGLSDQVLSGGKRIDSFNIYSRGKKLIELKVGEIGKGQSEFRNLVAFEQSQNEALLVENLKSLGSEVHWDHEFIDLKTHEDRVDARFRNGDDELEVVARYLIGCDGASSPVRTQLNFTFEGGTYAHRFFVADTTIDWDEPYDKLILTPGSKNFCAFFPLYGDRNVRMIGTLPAKYSEQENVTFDHLKETILKTSSLRIDFRSVNWFSVYNLHHRAVDHFNEGRVFLAGDSAHIHSPAGGQGMNTGLQDASNLAWKLALVLGNQAHASLLDTYNEERLPFARWLLRFTDRGFRLMTSTNWLIRFVRRFVALPVGALALSWARMRFFAFKTVSQIWYHYRGRSLSRSFTRQRLKFRSGDRLPYLEPGNIYRHFTHPSFHLLHLGDQPLPESRKEQIQKLLLPKLRFVEDRLDERWHGLGVRDELFILVRPDNHIGVIADDMEAEGVATHLAMTTIGGKLSTSTQRNLP